MQSFLIQDLKSFNVFLQSVSKFVPFAKFEVSNKFTKINSFNESTTSRAYFITNSMIAQNTDETYSFCLNDISKLVKMLHLMISNNSDDTLTLTYNDNTLSYNGKQNSFKLKTVKEELLADYYANKITSKLEYEFEFVTKATEIKNVMKANSIVATDNTKLYIFKQNDTIMCEIEDKSNRFSDAIAMPLADSLTSGDLTEVLCVKYDDFILMNLVPAQEVNVKYTNKKVFEINSNYVDGNSIVSMKLYIPTIKSI